MLIVRLVRLMITGFIMRKFVIVLYFIWSSRLLLMLFIIRLMV